MRTIIFLLIGLLLSGCSSTRNLDLVTVKKGTLISQQNDLDPTGMNSNYQIKLWKTKGDTYSKLELTKNKVEIEVLNPKKDLILLDSVRVSEDLGALTGGKFQLLNKNAYAYAPKIKPDVLKKYLQSKSITFSEKDLAQSDQFKKAGILYYGKHKWLFQTLTIPFKIRKQEGDVPSQVTTSFNAGIAYGRQWNIHKVRPIYDTHNLKMTGYDENKFSFSLAPFIGLTPVTLSAKNTKNTIETDQSVLGLSSGLAGVVSINSFNVGLAFGTDIGLKNSKDWIYQGEWWTGIVLGISIFK